MASRMLGLAALAASAAAGPVTFIPAGGPMVKRTGRVVIDAATEAVTLDWEGSSFAVTIANATFVGLNVSDSSWAGTRLGVFIDAPPKNGVPTYPHLRVLDVLTSPMASFHVIGRSWTIDNIGPVVFTVVNLIEPQIIGDTSSGPGGQNLTIWGFTTDGVVLPPPPPAPRKLAIIGDSITAGMGAAYAGPCTSGVYLNDYSNTYGFALCQRFGADCETAAWSGIGVICQSGPNCNYDAYWSGNMPQRFPYVLGGWPNVTSVYAPGDNLYNFSSFAPDAVLINLGTNDFSGGRASNATFVAQYETAYIAFVREQLLGAAGWNNPKLPVFIAVGSLSASYAQAAQNVVAALNAGGGNATYMDLMVNSTLPIGCAGHPSPAMHAAMADEAQPIMAAVLGW